MNIVNVIPIKVGSNAILLTRGRLKHSWLENQVLNKTPEFVVRLRHAGGWPALESNFSVNVQETIEMAQGMEAGYSPAQLVDELAPLKMLPVETRDLVKKAVHQVYLNSTNVLASSELIKSAALKVGDRLQAVLSEWERPTGGFSEEALERTWSAFLLTAGALRDQLDGLPKGIVLP